MTARLPVEDCLGQVVDAFVQSRPVILQAPPGAGKTTGVPPALLQAECLPPGDILLLQPRRIAARAAAHRLSQLAGKPVGTQYGYHVRFDRKVSAETRVIAMTTGILLRRLTADPLLDGVACVILDEFHERSLELDLVLGMIQRIRTTLRDELRLIVMSATLETDSVAALIPDAITIESQGRAFEVDVRYDETFSGSSRSGAAIAQQVCKRIPDALRCTTGDVLVFLPGVGEINRTAGLIEEIARKESVNVHQLYGDLSPAEQDAVLAPSAQRKIVLATNVAETSITLPGITCVIDSGLARVMQYDTAVGIPCLTLQPISKASADQRAGRSGRTAAGVCFRLWPQALQRSRADHTPPEIARADLSSAILTLAAWGEREVMQFPWVTPPAEHAVESATNLLVELGAIDCECNVTATGAAMNRLPLHPRLARLMLAAKELQCVDQAAIAAALLSERDPFDGASDSLGLQTEIESDLIQRIFRIEQHFAGRRDPRLHPGGAKNINRVARSLSGMIDDDGSEATPPVAEQTRDEAMSAEQAISRAMLAAFPDRLARRRAPGSASALMVGGRGVRLDRASAVRTGDLFLCIHVDGRGEEALVRMASAVDETWLPVDLIRNEQERFFHPTLKAVVARDRRYFLDLLINESPAECRADQESAALLFSHASQCVDKILPSKDDSLHRLLARWRFAAESSQSSLPADVETALQQVLRELCRTKTSFKQLASAPWLDHLQGMFSYEQMQWLNQHAPESIVVPSGNRIRIDYPVGKPPVLAVRIQEIFGWSETPRLAGGSVPVQLHLLGPNHRPQQITDDLKSFWNSAYLEVRKELKRRYAKHHWPDDPWSAVATRNGLKPKR